MIEFKLPSLGADMDQGRLLEWRIKPGEVVHKGQVVAVVDTSKAAVDIEIWQEGTVERLITQPDETIPVGTVMALLRESGEVPAPAPAAATGTVPQPSAAPAAPSPAPVAPPAPASSAAPPPRRRVSPAARRHAAELGVDIDRIVQGGGPDGAITVDDVLAAARPSSSLPPSPPSPPSPPPSPPPSAAAERATAMRRTIAAAMGRSKREIPHYYLSEVIPLQQASDWLAQANRERPVERRLLMAALLLKAVASCLRRYGDLNGWYRDERHVPADHVHLGVAIALRGGGLVAPALLDADRLSLDALMAALSDLIRRARAGSLRSSELAEPTVTVTNLGEGGCDAVAGVIYPPQVALVGFGRVAMRPWVTADGGLRAIPTVVASLAADHRVSDGHRGALFLAALSAQLQTPETL